MLMKNYVTVADINDVIKKVELNTSPGNNGPTSEYFTLFSAVTLCFLAQRTYRENQQWTVPSILDSYIDQSDPQTTKG